MGVVNLIFYQFHKLDLYKVGLQENYISTNLHFDKVRFQQNLNSLLNYF